MFPDQAQSQRFKLGLVGVGRMGETHLRALQDVETIDVVAGVDTRPEIRASLAARGLRTYQSVPEMLGSEKIDGALVAVPTPFHLETIRALVESAVPVLCEKPCGLNPGQAREAGDLARTNGVLLQIGFWRRFIPELQQLRDRVREGELGELYVVSCLQWDEYPAPVSFRATSGGILKDMGVHEFDMIRWLAGQEIVAASGYASSVRIEPPVPGEPEGMELAVQLSAGTVGRISLGRRFPAGEIHRIEVLGTQGSEELTYAPPGSAWEPWGPIYPALRAQAHAFAAAVQGGEVAGATAEDAAAALEAAELAARGLVPGSA